MSKAEEFLKTSLDEANILVSTNKILGTPINLDNDRIIIPYSLVKVSHLSGGSEYASKKSDTLPFGGISGGNFQMEPKGFLVIDKEQIKILDVEKTCFDKFFEETLSKILKKFIKK